MIFSSGRTSFAADEKIDIIPNSNQKNYLQQAETGGAMRDQKSEYPRGHPGGAIPENRKSSPGEQKRKESRIRLPGRKPESVRRMRRRRHAETSALHAGNGLDQMKGQENS